MANAPKTTRNPSLPPPSLSPRHPPAIPQLVAHPLHLRHNPHPHLPPRQATTQSTAPLPHTIPVDTHPIAHRGNTPPLLGIRLGRL